MIHDSSVGSENLSFLILETQFWNAVLIHRIINSCSLFLYRKNDRLQNCRFEKIESQRFEEHFEQLGWNLRRLYREIRLHQAYRRTQTEIRARWTVVHTCVTLLVDIPTPSCSSRLFGVSDESCASAFRSKRNSHKEYG